MSKINYKALIVSIIIPLATGGLSAVITHGEMQIYTDLTQPSLAPPAWVFPVVWSILFILMGISSYLIYMKTKNISSGCLKLYAVQLAVNFFWTILFFNFHAYLMAFIWILLLIFLIIKMIVCFSKISHTAAYLQIPYLIWSLFAAYLNIAIYLLNK